MTTHATACVRGLSSLQTPNRCLLASHSCLIVGMATETLKLQVHGMTCNNCARSVQKRIETVPGITKASVDLEGASATVEYDTDLVKPEAIANAVRSLGYEVPA